MRLIRSHLRNVCQHVDRVVDFPPGLVGVYGRNGAGKSNLLNMAYASLTNDYSRTHGTKPKCVRRGIEPGEPSFHHTTWEHQGTQLTIERDLLSRESDWLRIPATGFEVQGDTAIQRYLLETLRLRRQVLDNYVFVAQMAMFQFIDQTQAERAKVFSHLCGTAFMETIHAAVQAQIMADLPLTGEVEGDADVLRQQLGLQRQQVLDATESLEALRAQQLPAVQLQRDRKLILRYRQHRRCQQQREEACRSATQTKQTALTQRATAGQAREAYQQALAAVKQGAPATSEAQRCIAERETLEQTWQNYLKLQGRMTKLVEPTEPARPADAGKDAVLQEEQTLLKADLRQAQRLLAEVSSGAAAVCPLCSTPEEHWHDHWEVQQRRAAELPEQIEALGARIAVLAEYQEAMQYYRREKAVYGQAMAGLQQQVQALGMLVEPAVVNLEAQQEVIRQQTRRTKAAKQAARVYRKAKEAAAVALADWKTSNRRCRQLRSRWLLTMVKREHAQQALQRVKAHQATVAPLAALQERLTANQQALATTEAALRRFQEVRERGKKARNWIASLEQVRDLVFQRNQLPQRVHAEVLESLLGKINQTLARCFAEPFSVQVGEGLSLVAIKADGEEPAARLSGGQKGVLAIAVRLAINSLFASDVGMMVLDEPTVGLDEENIDCLHEALTQLSGVAKQEDSQIIVITHDRRLENAFDHLIQL